MPISVIIHLRDTDPVLAEIEDMPSPSDQLLFVSGPRRVDGKDLHYLATGVVHVIFPMDKIAFIEILPREEEDRIVGFVRE